MEAVMTGGVAAHLSSFRARLPPDAERYEADGSSGHDARLYKARVRLPQTRWLGLPPLPSRCHFRSSPLCTTASPLPSICLSFIVHRGAPSTTLVDKHRQFAVPRLPVA